MEGAFSASVDAARLATLQNIIGDQLNSEEIQSTIRSLVTAAGKEEDVKALLQGSGIIEKLSDKIAGHLGYVCPFYNPVKLKIYVEAKDGPSRSNKTIKYDGRPHSAAKRDPIFSNSCPAFGCTCLAKGKQTISLADDF
ncbi:hypothetical protein HDU97_009899 [Phlyctochytrium planicorne]|nr:hypothetical protein HDU97_009899 [Phlyctochytrium planicorne]